MLAYVFWHWPRAGVEKAAYEERLGRFHSRLASHPPEGYVSSASFHISKTSWIPAETGFEDWYLVTDFDALGELNEAAVSGSREEAHGQAAAYADGGTGGVYRAIAGQARLRPVRFEAWMSKPRGMTYPEFFAALAPWTAKPDITLWQRQLSLGPASEFCLHAIERHELPEQFQPCWVELSPVWLPA